MAVFSPTNAKVHFKAYDGSFTDSLSNTSILQRSNVAMSSTQTLFGQKSMYMADFGDNIQFTTPSVFDVETGDYTVGFWFHPVQFTSWDRLFVTDGSNSATPLRIYCHNGTIQVYVDDSDDEDYTATDSLASYYLGADAEDQWWHIMVRRDSGTTKTYINGIERGSSTMSYTIDNSASSTLGADQTGASGVKGYIQDFFWTEEAVSFTQADFTPATAEPITFHSGNPSISSFSTSAASVANSGDSVTLSWSVSGETKLELLKYVGGLLSSTEDVLGLSSKSVTITETVSYKIRATNDNSAVDSSSVQIQLSQGGNIMAVQPVGSASGSLVIQKNHLEDTGAGSFGHVMIAQSPIDDSYDNLNSVLVDMYAKDTSIETRVSSEEDARASDDVVLQGNIDAEELARTNADGSLETRLSGEEVLRASKDSSIATDLSGEISVRGSADVVLQANIDAEETARIAADGSLQTRLSSEEVARASDDVVLQGNIDAEELARTNADGSLETRLSSEEVARASDDVVLQGNIDDEETARIAADSSLATLVGDEETARIAADSSLTTRVSAEESLALANNTSQDARISVEESTRLAGDNALDARVDALESDFIWDGSSVATIGNFAKLEFVVDGTDMYMMVKKV